MILKYILAWIPMVFIGIANGMLRQYGYSRWMSELTAHQISSIIAIILFCTYIWFLEGKWTLESTSQALLIGLIWFGLTIAFEFLFGHCIAGHSWSKLLFDYNLLRGRLWSLVSLTILIAPWVIYRIRS